MILITKCMPCEKSFINLIEQLAQQGQFDKAKELI